MNKIQVLIRCSTLLFIAFLMTGCLNSRPTNSEIIGLWVEYSTDKDIIQPCGTFEFFEDGKFEAKNIPSKYFMSFGNLPERFDSNGTWELDTTSKDPFSVHQIGLSFAPLERLPLGFDSVLYISVDGETLFAGVDDNVLFTKEEVCE